MPVTPGVCVLSDCRPKLAGEEPEQGRAVMSRDASW